MNLQLNDLRKISGILSILAISADIVTLILFLKDIFIEKQQEFQLIITQVLIIILIFSSAWILGMFALKSEWQNTIQKVFSVFSWIYIIISALIFLIVSHVFIIQADYSVAEYFSMIGLIVLITFLALFISFSIDRGNQTYAIPYMIVIVWQIGLFTSNFITRNNLKLDWYFAGNSALFIITTLFVIILILVFDDGILNNSLTKKIRSFLKLKKPTIRIIRK